MAVHRIYDQAISDDGDINHRYVRSEATAQWRHFNSTGDLTTTQEAFIAGFLNGYAFNVDKERVRDVPDTGERP